MLSLCGICRTVRLYDTYRLYATYRLCATYRMYATYRLYAIYRLSLRYAFSIPSILFSILSLRSILRLSTLSVCGIPCYLRCFYVQY